MAKKININEIRSLIKNIIRESYADDGEAFDKFQRDEAYWDDMGNEDYYDRVRRGEIKLPSPEEKQKKREMDDAWREDRSNDIVKNDRFYSDARHHAGGTYAPKYDMNFSNYPDHAEFGTYGKDYGKRYNDWDSGNVSFDGNDNVYDDSNYRPNGHYTEQSPTSYRARMNKRNADIDNAWSEHDKLVEKVTESVIRRLRRR